MGISLSAFCFSTCVLFPDSHSAITLFFQVQSPVSLRRLLLLAKNGMINKRIENVLEDRGRRAQRSEVAHTADESQRHGRGSAKKQGEAARRQKMGDGGSTYQATHMCRVACMASTPIPHLRGLPFSCLPGPNRRPPPRGTTPQPIARAVLRRSGRSQR
jgi:hypothetical protein